MVDAMSPPMTTRQAEAARLAEQARSIYLANLALGQMLTGAELGEACDGRSERWGRKRIEEINASLAKSTTPAAAESSAPSATERHDTSAAEDLDGGSLPPIVTPPAPAEPSVEPSAPHPQPTAAVAAPAAPERHEGGTGLVAARVLRIWPVWLLMLPASVAIWGGWVGLGEMAGFGVVNLLPGIANVEINTAITLPVGMEVYAAYALYVWLSGLAQGRALRMARASAWAAMTIGALGQIAYHVMAAAGVGVAPWWITAGVACLPVAVLGMGAALAHLVRAEAHAAAAADAAAVPLVPSQAPAADAVAA